MTASAYLVEVSPKAPYPDKGERLPVVFKPQSVRLTHTATGPSGAASNASPAEQKTTNAPQVTNYTSSISMDLLFDTSRDGKDVRQQTVVLVGWTQPDGGVERVPPPARCDSRGAPSSYAESSMP